MNWIFDNERPIYLQLVEQLKILIISGKFKPGEKLPSVRELSSDMHINPNTVVKAYRILEQQGFIYSIPGKGSFVSSKQNFQTELFTEQINELIQEIVTKGKYIGISFEQLCDLIKQVWEEK